MGKMKRSWKGLACAALSAAMLVTSTAPAFAAEPGMHTYESGGLTFEKVSHMDTPTEHPDGLIDYIGSGGSGVYEAGVSPMDHGDRAQSYSYAAATYGDWVYVNTMYFGLNLKYIAGSNIMPGVSWETAKALMDVLYNGNINYGNEDNGLSGGVLVKVNVKTGETKLLMSRNLNGLIPTFRNAAVMDGKIYFEGMILNSNFMPPQQVNMGIMLQNGMPCIYEVDPATDEFRPVYKCVDAEGYQKLLKAKQFPSTRAIGIFRDDYMVAGGIDAGGSYLLISDNPAGGQEAFVKIADMDDLFHYPASGRDDATGGGGIYQVIEYNNSLYVGICSGTVDTLNEYGTMRPFAIVRGDCSGDPMDPASWTWTSLVGDKEKDGARYTFGIDPSRLSSVGVTLENYGGYLYIGEYNDCATALRSAMNSKTFDAMATNLSQSINLYRMDKDENIEMVVGDPTGMFPQGGISGKGSGYDTHMSQYTWQTEVYEDKMYISTMDMSTMMHPLAQLVNGELLNLSEEDLAKQLNYIMVLMEILMKEDEEVQQAVAAAEAPAVSIMSVNAADAALVNIVSSAQKAAARSYAPAGAAMMSMDAEVQLTGNQKQALVDDLADGTVVPGTMDPTLREDLEKLITLFESVLELLEELDKAGMTDLYDQIMEQLNAIREQVPEPLLKLLEQLANPETQKALHNVVVSLENMDGSVAGFDLYELNQAEDGSVSIRTITNDGFGDRYNHGLRIFVQTEDYLMVGTANPFYGTQLWRHANSRPGRSDIDPDEYPDRNGLRVTVTYQTADGEVKGSEEVVVDKNAAAVSVSLLNKIPEGWRVVGVIRITDLAATALLEPVSPGTGTRTINVTYVTFQGGKVLGSEEVVVGQNDEEVAAEDLKNVPEGYVVKGIIKIVDNAAAAVVVPVEKPEKPNPEKPNPEKPNPEKPNPEKPDPEKPDPDRPSHGGGSGGGSSDHVVFMPADGCTLEVRKGTASKEDGSVRVTLRGSRFDGEDAPIIKADDAFYKITGWAVKNAKGEMELIDLDTYRFRGDTTVYAVGQDIWTPFRDMKADRSDWFYQELRDLAIADIVGGYADGTYRAENQVTWGASLKLVLLAAGYPEQAQAAGTRHACSGYLELAKAEGIVPADADIDLFRNINREEFARITAKALKLENAEIDNPFTDTDDASVIALSEAGIINGYGDGRFGPGDSIKRSHIAAIIWRVNQMEK